MTITKSTDRIKREDLKAFGPKLGPLYHALYDEMVWLHAKWQEYKNLYAKSEDRVELLNRTASFFFLVVQDVLWRDVVLHIARLTSGPKSVGHDLLTLQQLPGNVPNADLADEVRVLVDTAVSDAEFAKAWRNNCLAHRDLAVALHINQVALPEINVDKVDKAISSLRAVMNRLERAYAHAPVSYQHYRPHGAAPALVRRLKIADEANENRKAQYLADEQSLPTDTDLTATS